MQSVINKSSKYHRNRKYVCLFVVVVFLFGFCCCCCCCCLFCFVLFCFLHQSEVQNVNYVAFMACLSACGMH